MTRILDNLWKILQSIPNEENSVFSAFDQTIHSTTDGVSECCLCNTIHTRHDEHEIHLQVYHQGIQVQQR